MLIKDPAVQPFFGIYIKNVLATSELNLLKRLITIETVLELNDYPIENDKAESTIPRQISLLSYQIKEIGKANNKQLIMEPIHKSSPIMHKFNQPRYSRLFFIFRKLLSSLTYQLTKNL
jgi:hypothetical protein